MTSTVFLPRPGGEPTQPPTRTPAPALAIPFKLWPEAFRYYAGRARDGDRGLGDVFERDFGSFGRLFKRFYRMATGHDCKCQERREWLNGRFPLPVENEVDRGATLRI